jgi:hypothetical protein
MRNLKKVLALALALVMTLSVMSFASAAHAGTSYTDDASITDYDEAIQVLTQLGIFKGGDGNEFDANATITREQAAAILYRVYTGDVNDESVELTAGTYMAAKFTDVVEGAWYTGYVGYCYNKGLMKGYDNGKFGIGDNLTGFQMLVMVLRAIGYDQEGEFTGADWELQAASKGYKDGITTTLRGVALSSEISRGAVAELMFRAVVKTQTVSYNKTTGYTKNNATIAGNIFNLAGTQAVANAIKSGVAVNDANVVNLITRSTTAAYDKYGAPYYSWYLPDDSNGNAVTVDYYLNPVASYNKAAVADEEIYAAVGAKKTVSAGTIHYEVDGKVTTATVNLTETKAASGCGTYGGKGVLTDVYVLESGTIAIAEKNTYVGIVDTAYKAAATKGALDTPLALTSASIKFTTASGAAKIDYPAVTTPTATAAEIAKANPAYATLDGIAKDSVVLYNIYSVDDTNSYYIVDYTTIKTATSADVTVTNTYNTTTAATSYFLVGTNKYEYSAQYGKTTDDKSTVSGNGSVDAILNRTDLVDNYETRQDIYFDDYGFVIYTTPHEAAAVTEGYLIARSGTYGQYVADNQYVAGFNVIMADGTQKTIQGAIVSYSSWTSGANAYYGNMGDANNGSASVEVGLYAYSIDSNGYYQLVRADDTNTTSFVTGLSDKIDNTNVASIDAGKADALDAVDSGFVVDDNTVFVIANYNANGIITGYNIKTGYKNIPDLDASGADLSVTAGNRLLIEAAVCAGPDADNVSNTFDLVFIRNAKQTDDSRGTATTDNVFVLTDTIPEEQFSEYDLHAVVMNGGSGFKKFVTGTVGGTTNGTGAALTANVFYTVKTTTNDYVATVEKVDMLDDIHFRAPGVLQGTDQNTDDTLVTLASNCVIYKYANGAVTTVKAEELTATSGTNACVAATDVYGFATVIYVVTP